MAHQQQYIHGRYHASTSGEHFETINPATGEVIATVEHAGQAELDAAVESAKQGQK
jgi:betaine-aldehyde dehydrogenase